LKDIEKARFLDLPYRDSRPHSIALRQK